MKKAVLALPFLLLTLGVVDGFCQSASSSQPDQSPFLQHKHAGDVCLFEGKADLAISEYEKAAALDPDSTSTYFNLAIACYSKGNVARTVRCLEKVIRMDPRDAEALYNLGCLKLRQMKLNEAGDYFLRAKKTADDHSETAALAAKGIRFVHEIRKTDALTAEAVLTFLKEFPVF